MVPLILHTKFQPNIPSHSGEKVNLNGFAILSIGGHLGFSTRLTFTGLKPCSLIMLHVKFEIHGCSGFREKLDLKARVYINCEGKDRRTENWMPMSHPASRCDKNLRMESCMNSPPSRLF